MRRLTLSVFAAAALASSTASAFTVRADRPRLLFGNGSGFGTTVATFIERCKSSDPAYANRCKYMGGGADNPDFVLAPPEGGGAARDTIGMAAASLLYGQPQRCSNAADWLLANVPPDGPSDGSDPHAFIVAHGGDGVVMGIVRDWCDAALSGAQKSGLEARIAAHADWMLAHYGNTGPGAEPADVYHDDYYVVANDVAYAGLALAGTSLDAKAKTYLSYADTTWKTVLFPAMAYAGDFWPEGYTYAQPSLGGAAWYAAGWSTATDEDIYAYVEANAGDLFNGYFAFFTYTLRPDDNFAYFGDTRSNKQSISLFIRGLNELLDYGTGSPLGQAFSMHVASATAAKNGFCDDVPCADGWMVPLFYDASKEAGAADIASLPTARRLGKGANDVAILRSGWGPDDTFVYMACGDYLAPHQHMEAGSFQIFRRSMLTGPDGAYDDFNTPHFDNYYSQHSVHANTLAIHMPGETFPTAHTIANGPGENVNDGGQRVTRRTDDDGVIGAWPSTDLATYQKYKTSGPIYETADMTSFEHASCHDYVACDLTAAYDSPGFTTSGNAPKVKEVTRQLVFLRPEIVVVFDRVESLDPSYEKRFLLHASAAGATPSVSGDEIVIDNGPGRLLGRTLLPANAKLNVLTGFEVDGQKFPPAVAEPEQGGNRVEVVPGAPALRDYFLHVFDATDGSKSAIDTTATETDAEVTVVIHDGPETTYAISFAKQGPMGGHIEAHGAVECSQDLGASAEGGSSGAGGGSVDDADSGAEQGCQCRAAQPSPVGAAPLVVAAALALLRRRRR